MTDSAGERVVDEQAEKGIRWLALRQNGDGGWGTHSGVASNIGATAYACRSLKKRIPERTQCTERSLRGISWMLDQRNADGGWGLRHGVSSSVFSTSQVLHTIAVIPGLGSEVAEECVEWLVSSQNDDGGWGLTPDSPSGIHDTTHAVFALMVCGYVCREGLNRAADWVARTQRQDGGWGLEGELSSPSLAVHAAEVLYHLQRQEFKEVLRRAVEFVSGSQQPDGSWIAARQGYNATYFTPVTLVKCGLCPGGEIIQKGIRWIRNSQFPDGGWPSEMQTGQADTLFTGIAVQALMAMCSCSFSAYHM